MADAESLTDRDLMLRFCSLGDTCEFGMAQRIFGAEPLDLLRWSLTGLGGLIYALGERFKGMGDPDQLDVGTDTRGDFIAHDTKYQFYWHVFESRSQTTADSIREHEQKRVPFLVDKLLRDLESGERVFVVRRAAGFPPHTTRALREALTPYSAPPFVLVTQGAPPAVSGCDEHGFLRGTVPRFADGADVPGTTDGQSWLTLCRAVYEHLTTRGFF